MDNSDIQFDRQHIWHPYTSMSRPLPCYPVVAARGVELQLADGRRLIDGMSSWWTAIHGYNHPQINAAVSEQLQQMSHVMFGGITHPAAVNLCRQLLEITPPSLECIFLADSGSVAVEVALKMALQYWQARGEPRQRFLSLSHAYHGDTQGAMSVCDPHNSMHHLYRGYLKEHLFVPPLTCGFHDQWRPEAIEPLGRMIRQHHHELAAVIIEPIVQGAGGMRFYHPNYLRALRQLCDEFQIVLIADEIATGFGRTGRLFACEHADITADILCLGKALTGGTMTLSATLTQRHIAETISNGEAGCFMHGPTFMGNPLACSAALASLQLLQQGEWPQQIKRIEQCLQAELSPLTENPQVADVRVLGAIAVVETRRPVNVANLQRFFVERGVWIRPFGRLIYLMPPYIIELSQLQTLSQAICAVLQQDEDFLFTA
ncbi:MAG: adenosylmethionine--8-amino-7-oxononanoate transaminase [Enterobacteriaceae bacterium]